MKENNEMKRGGFFSMKKRFKRIQALILTFVMMVSVFQGIPGLEFSWARESKAGATLYWPVPGHRGLSQGLHAVNGIDISDAGIAGARVVAAMGGKVIYIYKCGVQHYKSEGDCHGFGTGLVILGDDGRQYQYAHMQAGSIPGNVWYGARVEGGQHIGNVGTTGNSSGNHLHFGVGYGAGNYWETSGNPLAESYYPDTPVNPEYEPEGCLESVSSSPGQITVSGWARDRDSQSPIKVHVYVGGGAGTSNAECHELIANKSRGDVGAHGFNDTFKTKKTGNQKIYVYGINVGKDGRDNGKTNPQLNGSGKTLNVKPEVIYTVVTGQTTEKKNREAKISGSLSPAGNAKSWGFYIGTDKNKLTKCTVSTGSTPSSNMSAYVSKYYKLQAATTYYYQVWANVNEQEKKGSISSFTTTAAKPDIPKLKVDANSKDIGIGDNATVTWNAVDQADYYNLHLYDETGIEVETAEKITGTKYAFKNTKTSGKYSATVEAVNDIGSKGDSNVVSINVHPDVTVTFKDADSFVDVGDDYEPAVLGVKQVHWGKTASVPADPSHKGYTFKKWEGNYKNVKEDTTVKAVYDINQYTVKYVNSETNEVIGTEKVDYYSAAHPVDFDIPAGYAKAGYDGWDKDHSHITDNTMLFSCIGWYNDDFPIFANKTTAEREYDAEESANEGYTVKTELVNWDKSTTKGRLVVALKTKEGKLLTTTESSAFSIKKSTTKALEVFVPYEKSATIAEIYVVGQYKSAVPISTVKVNNNATAVIDQKFKYTDWSTSKPPASATNTESRVEYRYRDKSTTTSYNTSLSGYTQESSKWVQSGNGTIDYVASFPSGFSTGNAYYQKYNRSPVGAYENATNKRTVSTSTIGYLYWHWCRGTYTSGPINRLISDCWTSEFNTFHAFTSGALGYDSSKGAFYCNNPGVCKDTYWWDAVAGWNGSQLPILRCSYTDYKKQFTYYKWSDYSKWSTTKATSSSTREVQTRTVYRYQIEEPLVEDNSGEEREVKGSLGTEFAGKEAALFIYKVDEASDYTNEYVAQTKLDDNGNYDFKFKLREEPTTKTGDFTVVLGVEGTTAAMYLDTIEAPKKEYTVNFYDYNGKLLKSEKVIEGQNAELPDETALERPGYTFTNWTGTNVNVTEDRDLYAEYKINKYHVVFVDWGANTVHVEEFEYGSQLAAPAIEETDESVVAEWDAIADGNTTVTSDMVVCTRYTKKTCKVTIMDFDNKVVSDDVVVYGQAATIPQLDSGSDKIFLGWKDISEGTEEGITDTIVTKNVILCPVYVYKDTVEAPAASVESGEYDKAQTVTLSCDTDNANIYYTLDGSNPKGYSGILYTGPITIDDGVELQFYACKAGMNDSDVVSRVYAVNYEGAVSKWMLYEDIPEEIKNNASEYELYSEDAYRYKDVKKTTKLDEASALESTGWILSDQKEYTEYSDWAAELPVDSGQEIQIDVDKRPVKEKTTKYYYTHYKYMDGTVTAYSKDEPEGVESELEKSQLFDKPLSIAGFDENKNQYYVYDGVVWYNQSKQIEEEEVGSEYRWRYQVSVYEKWTDYSTEEPSASETRETEKATVFHYIRHGKYVVKIHSKDDVIAILAEKGDKISIPEECFAVGYEYKGLFTDSGYKTEWDLENDTVTSSMDLYIKYTENEYTVNFYNDDKETIAATRKVGYGQEATPPEMPKKDGYKFVGWDNDDYKSVKYDMDLFPVYIPEDEYATIELDTDSVSLYVNRSTELTAIITPRSKINTPVEWASSDESVATVSDDGKVTGVGEGSAVITAKVIETGEKATCNVVIKADSDKTLRLLKNTYLTKDKNGFLRGITPETKVSKVLNEFNNDNLVCKDVKGNVLEADDYIGTGSMICLMNGDIVMDNIIAVVTGDIDGDGEISNKDVSRLARMLLDKEKPSDVQICAGDVNGDGEIGNKDLSMISSFKLGKIKL